MALFNAEVIRQDYHRNGVGGSSFVVSLVRWTEDEEAERANPFVVISFLGDGRKGFIERTAVLSIKYLIEGSIDFARGNSWRGSDYLGAAVADAWRERCLSLPCPYDPFAKLGEEE